MSFERSEPTVDARRRQPKGTKSSISKTADLSSRQSEATRDLKKTQMIKILRLLIMTDSRFYRVKYRIHVILSVCSQPFLGLLTAGSSSFTIEVFCQALVTFYYAAMVIAVGQI